MREIIVAVIRLLNLRRKRREIEYLIAQNERMQREVDTWYVPRARRTR